ncbi:MAG TPA: phenylalanine--tRNA ligase subunit beta [Anaerolineae bacterium]|nr:phenylalanine--tRNA ligase subunit beta [Anaerolineae bacterium]
MNLVLSWMKDFVDIELSLEELAKILTMAGLEVEEVHLIGLQKPKGNHLENVYSGLTWERDKFVVAQVEEVIPHPNADRLVLCRLNDSTKEHIVLTGAPNLFKFKGKGALEMPPKVAYAREGAQIFDGHKTGFVKTTLKRMKIRGVESASMICSEKELGISAEHEGIIILDKDAPTGIPLVDYMGDAVFEVAILPNMIHTACMLGAAREIAAATNKPLRKSTQKLSGTGPSIQGNVNIQVTDAALNPRFVLGLVRGAEAKTSPYWAQLRLRLAGVRPINSIVDATNYIMLEIGEPLHAFDYDILVKRAGSQTPKIITRAAKDDEKLTTLDEVDRSLDNFTILVTDTTGPLALAGVMGGLESEVTEKTRNILLEGATWNFINTRRTVAAQRLQTEAGYRFSRNLHPALAELGVRLCLSRIAEWSGGKIAKDLVDAYPQPFQDPILDISEQEVQRSLGTTLAASEIKNLLSQLEFECNVDGDVVHTKAPSYRTDIGQGITGKADLMEEIARLHGYNKIPASRLADTLPPQRSNLIEEREQRVKDILVSLGLQEIINYRLTSPEEEQRIYPANYAVKPITYIELQNPISHDRRVLRSNLLASILQILEKNIRLRERLMLFEVGPIFLPQQRLELPEEPVHLAIALAGLRQLTAWDQKTTEIMDFFDMKGILEALFTALHITGVTYKVIENPSFHPGKCTQIMVDGKNLGVCGELHPNVCDNYDFQNVPVLAADLDMEAMACFIPESIPSKAVPIYPPVLEDLAIIVSEETPSAQVADVIHQAGGNLLSEVRLFDVFHGKQVGVGKKSLAYSLTYQADDRTLTDKQVSRVRTRIIKKLEEQLDAKIRSQ